MNKQEDACRKCQWGDNCDYDHPCQYYYIPGFEDSDEAIWRFIERGRKEYRRAWYAYVKDFE